MTILAGGPGEREINEMLCNNAQMDWFHYM